MVDRCDPPTVCDDPVKTEATYISGLLQNGNRQEAAARLQADAQLYRPTEYAGLLGEIKGISNTAGSLTHLEITPVPDREGDPKGHLSVNLVTPALDAMGRQYVDQTGRPMAVIDQVALLDNDRAVIQCPTFVQAQRPCFVERSWLKLDQRRGHTTFDFGINTPELDLRFRIGDWFKPGRYDDHRNGPPRYRPGQSYGHPHPNWGNDQRNGRGNGNGNGDRNNSNGGNGNDNIVNGGNGNDTTIINNTTIINQNTRTVDRSSNTNNGARRDTPTTPQQPNRGGLDVPQVRPRQPERITPTRPPQPERVTPVLRPQTPNDNDRQRGSNRADREREREVQKKK